MFHTFSEVRFKDDANLQRGLDLTRTALCTDKELPVRVEAAIALQMLLAEQEKATNMLRPHVKSIILGTCCTEAQKLHARTMHTTPAGQILSKRTDTCSGSASHQKV